MDTQRLEYSLVGTTVLAYCCCCCWWYLDWQQTTYSEELRHHWSFYMVVSPAFWTTKLYLNGVPGTRSINVVIARKASQQQQGLFNVISEARATTG